MKRLVLIVGLVFVLGGCGVQAAGTNGDGSGISRYIDEEAGVACWTFNPTVNGNHFGASIDCLPLSETKLDK